MKIKLTQQKQLLQKKKGFTLIELLIVIAIIGILAGVILVSTTTARDKASVASVKTALRSVMPYAQECYIKGVSLPTAAPTGGVTPVCPGSTALYPALDMGVYAISTITTYAATINGVTVTCNVVNGSCN